MTRAELASEKARIDQENVHQMKDIAGEDQEEEETYLSQPIYNIFNFFIGGPNKAKIRNKAFGKPNYPPY
jgi:hypothetical protein